MQKRLLLAILLALMLLLTGCAVNEDTVVIRVGDTTMTKGAVQSQVDYQLSYMSYVYSLYGVAFDPADPEVIASAQESVIEYLIRDAVMNQKIKELGLMDALTEEDQATLDARVEEAWQANLTSVKAAYFADGTLSGQELDDAVAAKAAEIGLTRESVLGGQKIIMAQEKLKAHVVKDVTLTDEEVQASYDLHVQSDQQTFAETPSYYGVRMNNDTALAFYRPAGYRMVKQILLPFVEADQAQMTQLSTLVAEARSAVSLAEADLAALGVADVDALLGKVTITMAQPSLAVSFAAPGTEQKKPVATEAQITETYTEFDGSVTEDVANAVKTLAEKKAVLVFYQQQMSNARENAYLALDAQTDALLAQLADGGDWDALMAENSADTSMPAEGYAVCDGYTALEKAFVDAAMDIPQVEGISPKIQLENGYAIIKYVAEVQEGAVPLEDVREELVANDLATKQDTVYEETLTQWVAEADAKVDRDALNKQ